MIKGVFHWLFTSDLCCVLLFVSWLLAMVLDGGTNVRHVGYIVTAFLLSFRPALGFLAIPATSTILRQSSSSRSNAFVGRSSCLLSNSSTRQQHHQVQQYLSVHRQDRHGDIAGSQSCSVVACGCVCVLGSVPCSFVAHSPLPYL